MEARLSESLAEAYQNTTDSDSAPITVADKAKRKKDVFLAALEDIVSLEPIFGSLVNKIIKGLRESYREIDG